MYNLLVICSHSDDEAIGLAGTLFKEAAAGNRITKVIFSYGELSSPHLKEAVIKKIRIDETKKANALLGIKKTFFIGLKDTKIKEGASKHIKKKLAGIITRYKPKKVFIPSSLDPHIDHRAVNSITTEVLNSLSKTKHKKLIKKIALYSYEVWNLVNELHPAIYEDITPYFKKKIGYIKIFKSQRHFTYLLFPSVYSRAITYGIKANCKYAEKFYRIQ